jgi:hypothetical protein
MNVKDEGRAMDAMLRHLGCGCDLRDFPSSSTEKVALVRIAGARQLIAWHKARARYELTAFGWNRLMPARRFGVGTLMMSAATGGMAGALAAAVLWLPADVSRSSARGHASASIARLERPHVPQTSRPMEISAPGSAPLAAPSVPQDAAAATAEPDTSAVEGRVQANPAERPAAEQPIAQPPLSDVKEARVKKSRHKTAYRRRREQDRAWARADPWRAQSMRYAGYGGQRGWFGYR